MTADRWAEIGRLCHAALEREPAARTAFLDEACAGDVNLHREVASLLARQSQADAFLEVPAVNGADGGGPASPRDRHMNELRGGFAVAQRSPSLMTGTKLGPYEIVALLGVGGMGEVYRARDTRLGRTVAVKILPEGLATDPDRRRRFELEARAASALNHPHICALFDVGEGVPVAPRLVPPKSGHKSLGEGGNPVSVSYLVMEHLEGETLAARIARGPLPIADVLTYGAQIADALAAAHRAGVVHRDLKPGNVVLTGSGTHRTSAREVKLLDFGLAKLKRPGVAATAGEASGAAPASMTAPGQIVGTLPYMAPEQIEGKHADARADIWALGAMLHEMVTGARTFQGASSASLMAAILEHEPAPLAATQPSTPPALDRLVRKCLAKDPDNRWASAHDLADELRWISTSLDAGIAGLAPAASRRSRRPAWRRVLAVAGAVALVCVGVLLAAIVLPTSRPAEVRSPVRTLLDVRPAEHLNAANRTPMRWWPTPGGARTAFSWTPDGRALVFVGQRGGEQQLFLRRLDTAEATPLPSTEGAQLPAISSDGQWVAFWAGGAIKKVPLAGGLAIEIARTSTPMGLVWGDQGALYFGNFASDILKVLPNGGLESVTTRRGLDPFASEIWKVLPNGSIARVTTRGPAEPYHALPWPLPGERAVLYTARRRFWTWGDEDVVAQPQGSVPAVVVLRHATDARYLRTGHLVFMREGVLFGVGFDAARLKVVGTPVPLVNGVVQALTAGNVTGVTGAGQFAVSTTGTLAWLPGAVIPYPDAALVTVDRQGQVSTLGAQPRSYDGQVQLSPDGRQLAVTILDLNRQSLWVYDLARTTLTPLVLEGEVMWHVWAPGGQHLVFNWVNGGRRLGWQPAEAGTRPDVLATGLDFSPASWTPDGRQLAGLSADDVAFAAIEKGHATMQPLRHTAALEMWPQFSPDGRWIAWGSTASGRVEIYVAPYPKQEPTKLVSVGGGESPRWNPNGRELFFIRPPGGDGKAGMMAVDFTPGAPPHLGVPRTLFQFPPTEFLFRCQGARPFYDVSRDGQRFYVVRRLEAPSPVPVTHISLVQNWFEELKAKVPAGSK